MSNTMDIKSGVGTKIRFLGKNGGKGELEKARRDLLDYGIYTVKRMNVGQFSSTVTLEENEESYNTVMFKNISNDYNKRNWFDYRLETPKEDRMSESKFGLKLKEARIKLGWNQEALAQKMNLKQASISQFEKGQRFPTPANIDKFCEILQLSRDYLAGEDQGRFERTLLMRNIDKMSPESVKKINDIAEAYIAKEQSRKDKDDTEL